MLLMKKTAENVNTRKSTINWVRVFETWCDENELDKNPGMVLPEQLDKILERFFACVCKQDGTDYEPGSLKVMQAVLDHMVIHFTENFSIPETEFLMERRESQNRSKLMVQEKPNG